jgi:hypothetical protein
MKSNYRYLLTRNLIAADRSVSTADVGEQPPAPCSQACGDCYTGTSNRSLLIWMLNPSTADEEKNDPTISRVCRLAENEGYSRVLVVNLFAVRATRSSDLWLHQDPFGQDNWQTWENTLKEMNPDRDTVCVAWGRSPKGRNRLLQFISALVKASQCLKFWTGSIMTWRQNLDGSPRHPLYISYHTKLQSYNLNSYVEDLLASYSSKMLANLALS